VSVQIGRQPKLLPFGVKANRFIARHASEDARINILVGSVRSSKTWAMTMKILALCKYDVAGRKVLTGVSKQAIYQNVLTDLFDLIGPQNYRYNRQSGELTLFGIEWLVIGAHDEGSEKRIRGLTVGVAVCDELILMPRSFFMMLLSRLSPAGARLYGTTNSDSPHHWLKTEIIDSDRLTRGLGRDLWVDTWLLTDNPNLSQSYREFVTRSYVGVWHRRFVLGEWVLAEGAIYRDVLTDETYYNDSQRPVGLMSRSGYVERWVSVDAGTVNSQVYGDFYDDGTTVWMDNEYYYDSVKEGKQKTNGDYADDLINGWGNWPGIARSPMKVNGLSVALDRRNWPGVIVDPSAASFKVELLSRGVYVVDASNEVTDGLRRVSSMLARKKLRIHERCASVRKDLETYSWDEDAAKRGKEQPIKDHDHGADMVRYYVETRINDWRLVA
jgi:PBSX family phage terminase large subunit